MTEKLSDKQARFAEMIALLILFVAHLRDQEPPHALLYRVRFGDAYRDPRATFPYGRDGSLHRERLAVDLVLDRWDGSGWVYQTETSAYTKLGEYWESLGGSWGGRFNDGNHFSLEHNGRR